MISGVTWLPGGTAWVFLHKQGVGYKFGGVATYRRCTNIPRQEMCCQGGMGELGHQLSLGSELS